MHVTKGKKLGLQTKMRKYPSRVDSVYFNDHITTLFYSCLQFLQFLLVITFFSYSSMNLSFKYLIMKNILLEFVHYFESILSQNRIISNKWFNYHRLYLRVKSNCRFTNSAEYLLLHYFQLKKYKEGVESIRSWLHDPASS
jgi:hypothetical protein